MDFLTHRERGMVFNKVFLLSSLWCTYSDGIVEIRKRQREFEEIRKRLRDFKEIEISGQSCGGEQQGRKLLRLLFRIRPRIRPQESDLERGGAERTSASSPHHHPISHLIRGFLFKDGVSVFSSSMFSTLLLPVFVKHLL
jgi:hypothetical protein